MNVNSYSMTRCQLFFATLFSSCAVLFPPFLLAQGEQIVTIGEKSFIVLPDAAPPENMIWPDYGEEIERFFGVVAYSNGAAESRKRYYQCTELIHRFLREVYGLPSKLGMGMGHGKDLARGVADRFGTTAKASGIIKDHNIRLEYYESGNATYPPVVGSIVSTWFNSSQSGHGHVAIIRTLEKQSDSKLSGLLFDEHGAIHKTVGIPIQPDRVVFEKDEQGLWTGKTWSWKFERYYTMIGWTNVAVVD